jgi:hypothetical protein
VYPNNFGGIYTTPSNKVNIGDILTHFGIDVWMNAGKELSATSQQEHRGQGWQRPHHCSSAPGRNNISTFETGAPEPGVASATPLQHGTGA